MGRIIFIGFICSAACVAAPTSGATWYVDGLVSSPGNGKSWETGFKTIQEGINAASHGDTILVAQGTYIENIKFNGKNIMLTGTDPLDSHIVANTIIDGNHVSSVVTFAGTENETCVLSGFTIRNGSGTKDPHRYPPPDTICVGGGIIGGDPWGGYTRAAILDNIVTDNSVLGQVPDGGGIAYCDGIIANNLSAATPPSARPRTLGAGEVCLYAEELSHTTSSDKTVRTAAPGSTVATVPSRTTW